MSLRPQLPLHQRRQLCRPALDVCGTSRNITTAVRPWPLCRARSVARLKLNNPPVLRPNEARCPSTTRSDGPLGCGTNRSGPKRCSGDVLGLICLPSVPFLGAFSVGIARKGRRRTQDQCHGAAFSSRLGGLASGCRCTGRSGDDMHSATDGRQVVASWLTWRASGDLEHRPRFSAGSPSSPQLRRRGPVFH